MYLLTRPTSRQPDSAQAFEQAGLNCAVIAFQTICPLPQHASLATEWVVQHPSGIVIVTSVAAADALREALTPAQQTLPETLRVVAIGDATANALSGIASSVQTPQQQRSEGVLRLPLLSNCTHQRILLLKGKGGRTHLQQALTQRGAKLTVCAVYERVALTTPTISRPINWSSLRGIVATSAEQAHCLIHEYSAPTLNQYRWLTVSERIAEQLLRQGILQVSICPSASDTSLIAWIKQHWE